MSARLPTQNAMRFGDHVAYTMMKVDSGFAARHAPPPDKLGSCSRREFLAGTIRLAAVFGAQQTASAQNARMRLILLGTGGGPRPGKASSAAAQVIITGGTAYVIDCGDGVSRQLVMAGVPLPSVRHIFLTHQHWDHNADYGNLISLAWSAGLRTRVDTWGPPVVRQ